MNEINDLSKNKILIIIANRGSPHYQFENVKVFEESQ
jgi:hypothetical protein